MPAGFTIGSFTSVSLDPPLVGFLPQIASDTWQAMAPAGRFCVNVLRDDQAELCWRFAKSGVGDDRFDNVTWSTSPTGCPIIEGVGAWIDCATEHVFELGDHYFVVGRVVDLDHHAEPHTPLVFYKGALGGFPASRVDRRPDRSDGWPAPPARSFVGRAAPLALLQRSLDEALAGTPRAVLVEGDAGIGKSRLAAELLDRARRRGAVVLVGRCSEDLNVPYLALATALDPLGGELGGRGQLLDPAGGPGPATRPARCHRAAHRRTTRGRLPCRCPGGAPATDRAAARGPPLGRPAHRRAARAARRHVLPRRHAGVDGDPLRRHAAAARRPRRPHRRAAATRAARCSSCGSAGCPSSSSTS